MLNHLPSPSADSFCLETNLPYPFASITKLKQKITTHPWIVNFLPFEVFIIYTKVIMSSALFYNHVCVCVPMCMLPKSKIKKESLTHYSQRLTPWLGIISDRGTLAHFSLYNTLTAFVMFQLPNLHTFLLYLVSSTLSLNYLFFIPLVSS